MNNIKLSSHNNSTSGIFPTYVNNINISNNYTPTTVIYQNTTSNTIKNSNLSQTSLTNSLTKKDNSNSNNNLNNLNINSNFLDQVKPKSNTINSKTTTSKPAFPATSLIKSTSKSIDKNKSIPPNSTFKKNDYINLTNSNKTTKKDDCKTNNSDITKFSTKKRARETPPGSVKKSEFNESLFNSDSESEFFSEKESDFISQNSHNVKTKHINGQNKFKKGSNNKNIPLEIQVNGQASGKKSKTKGKNENFILTPCNYKKKPVNEELENKFKDSLNSMNAPKRKKVKAFFDFESIVKEDNNLSYLSFLDNNDKNSKIMILQNQVRIEKEKNIAYQNIEHIFMRSHFPEEYTNENFFLHTMLKHDRQKKVRKFIANISHYGKNILANICKEDRNFENLSEECNII